MEYNRDQLKQELLEVKNGEQWNIYAKKYPDFLFSGMDSEMKAHFNWLIKQAATKEQLENPHIHYEVACLRLKNPKE